MTQPLSTKSRQGQLPFCNQIRPNSPKMEINTNLFNAYAKKLARFGRASFTKFLKRTIFYGARRRSLPCRRQSGHKLQAQAQAQNQDSHHPIERQNHHSCCLLCYHQSTRHKPIQLPCRWKDPALMVRAQSNNHFQMEHPPLHRACSKGYNNARLAHCQVGIKWEYWPNDNRQPMDQQCLLEYQLKPADCKTPRCQNIGKVQLCGRAEDPHRLDPSNQAD